MKDRCVYIVFDDDAVFLGELSELMEVADDVECFGNCAKVDKVNDAGSGVGVSFHRIFRDLIAMADENSGNESRLDMSLVITSGS